eukprot:1179954-Prorocentrum_minimum.AAC.1
MLGIYRLPSCDWFSRWVNTASTPAIGSHAGVGSLYLDTTYCDPRYTFPPQRVVLAWVAELVTNARRSNKRTLFVVGSYSIGKEKGSSSDASEAATPPPPHSLRLFFARATHSSPSKSLLLVNKGRHYPRPATTSQPTHQAGCPHFISFHFISHPGLTSLHLWPPGVPAGGHDPGVQDICGAGTVSHAAVFGLAGADHPPHQRPSCHPAARGERALQYKRCLTSGVLRAPLPLLP